MSLAAVHPPRFDDRPPTVHSPARSAATATTTAVPHRTSPPHSAPPTGQFVFRHVRAAPSTTIPTRSAPSHPNFICGIQSVFTRSCWAHARRRSEDELPSPGPMPSITSAMGGPGNLNKHLGVRPSALGGREPSSSSSNQAYHYHHQQQLRYYHHDRQPVQQRQQQQQQQLQQYPRQHQRAMSNVDHSDFRLQGGIPVLEHKCESLRRHATVVSRGYANNNSGGDSRVLLLKMRP